MWIHPDTIQGKRNSLCLKLNIKSTRKLGNQFLIMYDKITNENNINITLLNSVKQTRVSVFNCFRVANPTKFQRNNYLSVYILLA